MNGEQISTTAEAQEQDALPRARVVHADPATPATPEQKPLPEAMSRKPMADKSPAEWAYERLIVYIADFEEQLDAEHEVSMGFAGSDSGVLRIEGLGFFEPDMITFYGTDEDGARTQLIQHVSQLNVMLRALPKVEETKPAQRIGFRLFADLEEGDNAQ